MLALDVTSESAEAPNLETAPSKLKVALAWTLKAARLIVALLKRVAVLLEGPARRWGPQTAKIAAMVVLAGALVAGLALGGRWAVRTIGPQLSEAWASAWVDTGSIVVESEPPGSQVYIDGNVAGETPMSTKLAVGRHLVEFRRGENIRSVEVEIAAGQATVSRLDWSAARTGVLRVESDPVGVTVVVDGRERGAAPLTLDDLVVGRHEVVLRSEQGSVRRTVTISVEKPAQITESLYPGWMHVSAPIEVGISAGRRSLRLDDQNRILLPPGTHEVQFENRQLGYLETRRVQVRPGEVTRVLIDPSPSTLSVTSTLAAEVFVDGQQVGYTPLSNHPVKLGTRDIVVRAQTGEERRFTMAVSATPIQLDVDFSAQ